MKFIVAFLLFAISLSFQAQNPLVSLQCDITSLQQGDSLHFSIWCNSSEALEVFVLTNDSLLFQQNVQISYSELPFHIDTTLFPLGKYFILVTGGAIHIEREFLLWKER